MSQRGFRERVAVALLGAAVVVGTVLGVMTIKSFTQPSSTALAVQQGGVSAAQANGNASPASMPGAPGTGGSTTSSGGGGGGVAGGNITIGGFFDITGPVDSSVERDTVRAYMQAINQSGGINGRKVQYVWCDSKYDASSAHACAQYLIAQNVLAVVGLTAPLGENNEIRTLTSAGIPVIGGLGTPAEYADPLSFPVSANFYRYGGAIADEAKRQQLNSILHPFIMAAQDAQLQDWEQQDPNGVAVVDAALMIESGGYRRFDKLIVVHCPPEVQLQRLMSREGLTRDEAERRINTQMPQEQKKKFADFLIDTSDGFQNVRRQTQAVFQELVALSK